ncbi:TolC family protein [Trinickia dinghuensis]|uniref:TolC family protein n=2 Tax=Trinickia dinghuensis TaxID=2291023 RepID=A0A3D8K489_9BURK|nr:TolC family protein [Trinickia dinghuensis]
MVAAPLAGCVSPVRHTALPSPDLPARWKAQSEAIGDVPSSPHLGASDATPRDISVVSSAESNAGRWWQAFGDAALDKLVDEALAKNADLSIAAIRVRRAQLAAGLVDAESGPRAKLAAQAYAMRAFDADRARLSAGVNATVSFELDLWGKLAARRDEATWRAQASEADREAAALLLIGTTAKLYWGIGASNESIALGEASIADAARTVAMMEIRLGAGAASPLDLAQARRQLAVLRAEQAQWRMDRESKRNALAALLDRLPEERGAEPERLSGANLPEVPASLPALVLARRPDLRAAELRLRARLANVDFTRAAIYPSLSLTSEFGTSSDMLVRTLQNPIASFGTALALPFIQWNTVRLKAAVSETEFDEASIEFRKQLYRALADVENALAAKTQLDAQATQRTLALEDATLATADARARFDLGATDAAPWLEAQRAERSAGLDRLRNHVARLENRVDLFLALGGG